MNRYSKWIRIFLITILSLFCITIGAVVLVDPFFQYHAPLKNFPYIVDNQVNQNPGMAKNREYDSILLGSSMTVNFNTDWFYELKGENTAKLSCNGAYPRDNYNLMKLAFSSDNEIKAVYLGIDPVAYTAEVTETKYPVPEYLYDSNIFNDISYVLNKDVILQYIIKPVLHPSSATSFASMYHLGQSDDMFDGQYVIATYEPSPEAENEADTAEFIKRLSDNLDINICPFIEENPDTEFIVFFPPYSILFWNEMILQKRLDATIEEYRYIYERLSQYSNVKIFLFSDQEKIITNMTNYSDYSHYHESINRYMAECFVEGTCEITKENASERIDNLSSLAHTFNYSSLINN